MKKKELTLNDLRARGSFIEVTCAWHDWLSIRIRPAISGDEIDCFSARP